MYRLFGEFAHRYDLHTPPQHYQHDHQFVVEQARGIGSPCHLLDIGCGTGVLLEKAHQAGLVVEGIDISPEMIQVAERRLGLGVARVQRMQELDATSRYHVISSLSWTLNYCTSRAELTSVLQRCYRALHLNGRILLQVAHAPNIEPIVMEDRESSPSGTPDDIVFLYRFKPLHGDDQPMLAEYVYACKSLGELVHEQHLLKVADAQTVASCAVEAGFVDVTIVDSWRGEPLAGSASPFIIGRKAG